jgi:hypothetical protein
MKSAHPAAQTGSWVPIRSLVVHTVPRLRCRHCTVFNEQGRGHKLNQPLVGANPHPLQALLAVDTGRCPRLPDKA